ncbi:MAG: GDSL-type esterase/lipase family protein [Myxococcota bacterium]
MKRVLGVWLVVFGVGFGCDDGAASSGGDGGDGDGQGGTVDTAADATPDEPGPALSAKVTLVALGDSLTEGIGDTEWTDAGVQRGYPDRLRAKLVARGADVQVTNLGKSGWTSSDMVKGVDWAEPKLPGQLGPAVAAVKAAVAGGRKAVAAVWIGSNDLFGLYGWCHAPDNAACEADNIAEFKTNLTDSVAALKAAGATVVIALLDDQSKRPVVADPAFDDILPGLDAAAAKLMTAQVGRYNAFLATLAASEGARTVDFFSAGIFDSLPLLDADGIHPNAAGYDRITTLWESAVDQALGP